MSIPSGWCDVGSLVCRDLLSSLASKKHRLQYVFVTVGPSLYVTIMLACTCVNVCVVLVNHRKARGRLYDKEVSRMSEQWIRRLINNTTLGCPCGSVAERSKALVLGTSLFGGAGSNPAAARYFIAIHVLYHRCQHYRVRA